MSNTSERDKLFDSFYGTSLRLMRSRLCNEEGCEDDVFCSECRHLAGHVTSVICDAVAAETERCACIADTEAAARAAYAGKLDRSGEINVGAQQYMASLALSQIAVSIRAPREHNHTQTQSPQHKPLTNEWLATVVRDVEAMDCDEPLAGKPPSLRIAKATWTQDRDGDWRADLSGMQLDVGEYSGPGTRGGEWLWSITTRRWVAQQDQSFPYNSAEEARIAAVAFAERLL